MDVVITLPNLGDSVSEATVGQWLKDVGDHVEPGEPLLEVSTDKVDTEIPSLESGVLVELLVAENQDVLVGAPLARISRTSDPARPPRYWRPGELPAPRPIGERPAQSGSATRAPHHERPTLRRPEPLPQLTTIRRSERQPPAEKMSRPRPVTAQRVVEPTRVSARPTSMIEIDVTRIAAHHTSSAQSFLARYGYELSFTQIFAAAAVQALRSHPELNASLSVDRSVVTFHDSVHLSVTVDTERGPVTPTVHDASDLVLSALARVISDLTTRARDQRLATDELTGGTFTLTDTGSRGTLMDTPIIDQPQVAILGIGAVVQRPVVVMIDDHPSIAIRSMACFSLTYDHRLVDGAYAAHFLATLKLLLEDEAWVTKTTTA